MGPSRGGFFLGDVDPNQLRERLRKAEDEARDAGYETSVSGLISDTLAAYNSRNVDEHRRILDKAKEDLSREVGEPVELLFGGSVAKHTYVDGLSDVDALVVMDRSDVAGDAPEEILEAFADRLRTRFGRDNVKTGALAVTISTQGHELQLLPAIREGSGFRIASSTGRSWIRINPVVFARALTQANQDMNGKLVPTIKLAKSLISSLPEQQRLSGYHTETLALRVFRDYSGLKTPAAMLRHFFAEGPNHVRQPIDDPTGQSAHVDEYLGPAESIERRVVAHALERISRRIRNADGAQSLRRWQQMLGEEQ